MAIDLTLAFLRDPYRLISRLCRERQIPVIESRLLLRPAYFMTGAAAAKMFYDPELFERKGAAPEPVRATLFGKGGVQGLDAEAHQHRKQMLTSIMNQENLDRLLVLTETAWFMKAQEWTRSEKTLQLYDEAQELLTRAVCKWAGVSLKEEEIPKRARQLSRLFDAAGAKSLGHLQSRMNRGELETWLQEVVEKVRRQERPSTMNPVQTIAWYKDPDGQLLPAKVAAVEILNLLRPTVAVSVYVVFIAHVLCRQPQLRHRLRTSGYDELQAFVQEVRRYYPFFPAVMATVKRDFEWAGVQFKKGRRAVLDLFGTNQDPEVYAMPQRFHFERFLGRKDDPFNFIPQGGGHAKTGHRCAGENLTVELMKQATEFLTEEISYKMPDQDMELQWDRMPAVPKDRMKICKVTFRKPQLPKKKPQPIFPDGPEV